MKKIFLTIILFLFCLLFYVGGVFTEEKINLTGNISPSSFQDKSIYQFKIVEPISTITFFASSTFHDFEGSSNNIMGEISGSFANFEKTKCEVSFDVKTLHTGVTMRDKDMWSDFEADKYPDIKFKLTSVNPILTSKMEIGGVKVSVTGDLTIHNVTHSISFPLDIQYVNGFLRFTGDYKLNMKDYGIKPHSSLYVIRVDENVVIKFDIYSELASQIK